MPAGFSQVTVCNMALSHVSSKINIESIDEENTPARACKLWYDVARLTVLEAYNWGFARKSLAMTLHSVAAPTTRWAYRYQYPADCVSPRYIENPAGITADAVPYEIEEADDDTQCIVTDLEDATLIYTRNLETVDRYSMHSTLMWALQLAIFINPKLTGKSGIAQRLQGQFDNMLVQAPTVDATGQVARPERDAGRVRARA